MSDYCRSLLCNLTHLNRTNWKLLNNNPTITACPNTGCTMYTYFTWYGQIYVHFVYCAVCSYIILYYFAVFPFKLKENKLRENTKELNGTKFHDDEQILDWRFLSAINLVTSLIGNGNSVVSIVTEL